MVRRGFTLIELVVALGVVALLAALGYAAYMGVQRNSRDSSAIALADQVAANFQHYAALNGGVYPACSSGGWDGIMTCLGQAAEFSPTPLPPVFDYKTPGGWGSINPCTNCGTGTFQLEFSARGGTGAFYCRDPNGLAKIPAWDNPPGGPYQGCP
jgi:prepilin-type N-terminal cleavage/methylation domain-containing protein